jgi:hypothetical protein
MVDLSNLQPTEHERGDHSIAGTRRLDSLPVRAASSLSSYTTPRDTNRALEEGISIMVFSQSKAQGTQSLFADLAQVPFWLLENIKKMTTDIEVKAKSVTEWRTAIAEGFKLMDQLRTHKGGIATCNLDVRTLTFRPPES